MLIISKPFGHLYRVFSVVACYHHWLSSVWPLCRSVSLLVGTLRQMAGIVYLKADGLLS